MLFSSFARMCDISSDWNITVVGRCTRQYAYLDDIRLPVLFMLVLEHAESKLKKLVHVVSMDEDSELGGGYYEIAEDHPRFSHIVSQ